MTSVALTSILTDPGFDPWCNAEPAPPIADLTSSDGDLASPCTDLAPPPGGIVPSSAHPSPPVVAPASPRSADELDELGARIVGLSARIAGATCRWLLLVAEFDRREGYARWGLASTAQWLAHACGIAHRTAVEHARVARALESFPDLAAALQAGRISYSHARAIARLARPGEHQLVGDLLGVAEHGSVGQLETVVRGLRTVDDNAADASAADAAGDDTNITGSTGRSIGEYVRPGWAPRTSHWRLSARLDPERGALVEAAVAQLAAAEAIPATDALVRIAEIALAALHRRPEGPPRGLRGHERAAVLIHLNAAALPAASATAEAVTAELAATEAAEPVATAEPLKAGASTAAGGGTASYPSATVVPRSRERGSGPEPEQSAPPDRPFAHLANGPGLPRSVVERLLCACRVRVAVLDDDRNVLDLGRTRRVVDDRLLRALLLRDTHCSYPGCTSANKLEAHHVIHWLHGGRTDLANLVLLCERHHHAHHDGDFTIERVDSRRRGTFEFRRPDGSVLPRHVDPSRHVESDTPPIETEHAHIPDTATLSKSVGDHLDRAWAIAVLAHRRQVATPIARVPAA